MKPLTRPQLEARREKLLDQLAAAGQRSSGVLSRLGHGYAMRAYTRLHKLSFRREDDLKERLEAVERALRELGWRPAGEAPPLSEAEALRHYREVMGLPEPEAEGGMGGA